MSEGQSRQFLANLFKSNVEAENLIAALITDTDPSTARGIVEKYTDLARLPDATEEDVVTAALVELGFLQIANRIYNAGVTR